MDRHNRSILGFDERVFLDTSLDRFHHRMPHYLLGIPGYAQILPGNDIHGVGVVR
jgi:hypothetical protein